MKLSVTEDVALPCQCVFDRVSDLDLLLSNGVPRDGWIERVDAGQPVQAGSAWNAEVPFRGRRRRLSFHVQDIAAPEGFTISGLADGVSLHLELSLTALAANSTRLRLISEIKPRSVAGRVLVQTVRLMKSTLQARYKDRVRGFLRRIEAEAAQDRAAMAEYEKLETSRIT